MYQLYFSCWCWFVCFVLISFFCVSRFSSLHYTTRRRTHVTSSLTKQYLKKRIACIKPYYIVGVTIVHHTHIYIRANLQQFSVYVSNTHIINIITVVCFLDSVWQKKIEYSWWWCARSYGRSEFAITLTSSGDEILFSKGNKYFGR